ncbi:sensor histidine kinase [Sphingomonas sp.]|uniref:sensor histidine kinase n=1 Tax=Sphingomonas sp. TaxID=28214 RepID=UPI002DD663F4|nr:response regulator [Sphingomonas sp.]
MSARIPAILYIDDDEGLRRLAERGLKRRGFDVTLAATGEDGIALAASRRFDLVTVDHYMPGLDGLETLKRLRALPTAPPVIYVTGSEEGRVAIAALRAGAVDYVVKSVGEDFLDLLARAIENELARVELSRGKDAAEWELRASHSRLEALLREVNHRVANSLQLVSAFVRLQSSAIEDAQARAALEDTQRRIAAIGSVHRRLYTSNDVEGVELSEYLAALVGELAQSWSNTFNITLLADKLRVPTDRAVSIGVIVNELVSNACKYAYEDMGGGEIRVLLRKRDGETFELAVEDDGVGMTDGAPKGTGLGTKLVRTMAQSLQSAVTYEPRDPGLRASLVAPLN